MKTILLTASGYYGSYNLVKELKDYRFVGVDMNPNAPSKFYCSAFYVVPPGTSKEFVPELLKICQKEKVDVILPASSCDVYNLADNMKRFEKIGVKVMVSDLHTTEICLDKVNTYNRLQGLVQIPKYFGVRDEYCLKPIHGKGSRGFQTLYAEQAIIMEKLEGEQVDIDVLSYKGKVLLQMSKLRKRAYGGTLVEGEVVSRPYLEKQVETIINELPLQYLSVIQFMGGRLLEVNPRIAGAIVYPKEWNMPRLAIQLALGYITPQIIKTYQDAIPYGRKITRYLDQICY